MFFLYMECVVDGDLRALDTLRVCLARFRTSRGCRTLILFGAYIVEFLL